METRHKERKGILGIVCIGISRRKCHRGNERAQKKNTSRKSHELFIVVVIGIDGNDVKNRLYSTDQ